jgi:uncharacterized Zn finger protein
MAVNPSFIEARYLLMYIYAKQGQWPELRELAQDTLKLAPGDPTTLSYLNRNHSYQQQVIPQNPHSV